MKKLISIITLSTLLLFTGIANAETRVAIVDVVSILERMPQKEAVTKALDDEFSSRAKVLQEEEKKAQEASQKLQKDKMVLSASEKTKLENIITSFQKKVEEFSIDYQKRKNEEANKLLLQIQKAVKTIAEKEHYNLVLKAEAVFYLEDKVDITNKVLAQVKR